MRGDEMLGTFCGATAFVFALTWGFAYFATSEWPKFWFGVAGMLGILASMLLLVGGWVFVAVKFNS